MQGDGTGERVLVDRQALTVGVEIAHIVAETTAREERSSFWDANRTTDSSHAFNDI
jgi:hypothetical protein